MTADEINAAVAAFREQEMVKVHATVNSALPWRRDELAAEGVRALDVRAERHRRSLGEPDAQSIAQDQPAGTQGDEPPAPVVPGVK